MGAMNGETVNWSRGFCRKARKSGGGGVVYIHTYIHTYIYIYIYVCMSVCMFMCSCVYVFVY